MRRSSLLLAFALPLSLVACGGNDTSSAAADDATADASPTQDSASNDARNDARADTIVDAHDADAIALDAPDARDSGDSSLAADADASVAPRRLYWGAIEDGPDTFDFYYGPKGFWQNAPWGNTGNTMDKFDTDAGKKVSILSYGQPPPWDQTTFYTGTMDIVVDRGAIPFLTMSTGTLTLAEIAGGAHDADITTWAKSVRAYGKPFLLRFAWEMNGDWYSWGQKPTDYVAAWRHFHDVVTTAGATNVTWVWCPNLEYGPYPLASYFPGDAYVDWLGVDGYNKGCASQSIASLYKPTYDALVALSKKPIIIAEVASLEYGAGDKAAWIHDVLDTQLPTVFPQVHAFVWFNWRFDEADCGATAYQPFPIESTAPTLSAFHDAIASSTYVAGGSFPMPAALTKIAPP